MDAFISLIFNTIQQVLASLAHNWPYLIVSILVAVLLKLYINPSRVSDFLLRHRKAGVIGATAAAVGTPLCSCGTTAVVLGMTASMLPWAPIVAFMVASPLTSPEEMFYSAGLFGWPFAIAFFISSILLGLLGGLAAGILESRGWLANQARFSSPDRSSGKPTKPAEACSCENTSLVLNQSARIAAVNFNEPVLAGSCCGAADLALDYDLPSNSSISLREPSCGCSGRSSSEITIPTTFKNNPLENENESCETGSVSQPVSHKVTLQAFLNEILNTAKRLLPMFLGFAFIGFFLNGLIPATWVSAIFGSGNIYSVPLAATLGLPLYINTEGSLPLVRALIDGGMSQGAALAFLITGAGTSVGAIAGALTIARWRVIGLVIGTLWIGAVVIGFGYNILLGLGIF
ncbi:MAG: permease [Anaerolineaceae bacterium]|nr:permease [Anaerolineaceae bacterium]